MNNTSAAPVAHTSARSVLLPTRPLRFLARLAIMSLALLWLAQVFSVDLVERMLPAFRAEVVALDDNISIISLDLIQDGPSNAVRMRANLLLPIYTDQGAIYPFGWKGSRQGGYQIYLNTRGVLQSSLILLIVVLSWPHRSRREFAMRLSFALPLTAALIAIDAPLELVGNFQHAVLRDVDPHGFHAIFGWDKFLEGGGNCVLALAFAALAIVSATRASARTARVPQATVLS
jgi:hypothetical protein